MAALAARFRVRVPTLGAHKTTAMSSFIIHRVAIHFLDKQPEMADCNVILADRVLPLTDDVINLVARLDSNFEKKTDMILAAMPMDEGYVFPDCLSAYTHERDTDSFVEFTQLMTKELQEKFQGVIGARGGHLVFSDYAVEETRMFGVFLLRKQDQYDIVESMEADDVEFLLDIDQTLDVDKSAFSVRIMPFGDRPVHVVRQRKQDSLFNYMLDWLCIEDQMTASEATLEFMEVMEEMPLPKDPETGFALNQTDFDKALMKYAAKQPQQTIRAKLFDEHFYGNETPLQDMLIDSEYGIDNDFRVDKKVIRRKFHLGAGERNLRITCTSEHIREGLVHIDEVKGTITINSRDIAIELADQVEE